MLTCSVLSCWFLYTEKGVVFLNVLDVLDMVKMLHHVYFVHMLAQVTESVVSAYAVEQRPTQIFTLYSCALRNTGRL